MLIYESPYELKHYGVLGMKWGVRKARKLESKAGRLRAEGKNEAADRAQSKSVKKMEKHTKLAGGKKAVDYIDKKSTARLTLESLFLTTYGSLRYNQLRAEGMNRGRSFTKSLLPITINNLSSGF
jgi:hypothetical protein